MQTDRFSAFELNNNNNSNSSAIPNHVAIIMDGNGRFATMQGKSRSYGHKMGASNLINICRAAKLYGIKYLSVYAFSTENWQRPQTEIKAIFALVDLFFDAYLTELLQEKVAVKFIGLKEALPANLQKKVSEVEVLTANNQDFYLIIALNYGAKQEIADACLHFAKRAVQEPSLLNMSNKELQAQIAANLWTAGIPDPDLLIRTAGELRLSNFLLWQTAYTELYSSEKLWPEFTANDLALALQNYSRRLRKFGALPQEGN